MDANNLLKPWHDACRIWPVLREHKLPEFRISPRLVKTAGLCYVETGEITLSGPFLAQYPHEMMTQILAHETAHYIDYCLNGWRKYKRHHGREWSAIMLALGYKPDPFHTMELR